MPLEFESLSHGKIAFGFFNIETDMILLNQHFLFAEDFCHHISKAARANEKVFKTSWEVYSFQNREDIGNLMGAIHGIDHSGFVGEVYKLYPFPRRQEDFKQNPEGFQTRSVMESLVQSYTKNTTILFAIDQNANRVEIGEYLFDKLSFHELIRYIWMGGFPRWKEDTRPDYVFSMKKDIDGSRNSLLDGLILK
jgi:hypothetical protein